jgi:hypothetical protein
MDGIKEIGWSEEVFRISSPNISLEVLLKNTEK